MTAGILFLLSIVLIFRVYKVESFEAPKQKRWVCTGTGQGKPGVCGYVG
jgi:hypothetical protein